MIDWSTLANESICINSNIGHHDNCAPYGIRFFYDIQIMSQGHNICDDVLGKGCTGVYRPTPPTPLHPSYLPHDILATKSHTNRQPFVCYRQTEDDDDDDILSRRTDGNTGVHWHYSRVIVSHLCNSGWSERRRRDSRHYIVGSFKAGRRVISWSIGAHISNIILSVSSLWMRKGMWYYIWICSLAEWYFMLCQNRLNASLIALRIIMNVYMNTIYRMLPLKCV